MKKLTLHILKFGLILFVLLLTVRVLSANYIAGKSKFKIPEHAENVIIGHSHPEYAFNDSLIVNTVNVAQSGDSFFFSYFKLNQVLQQNKNVKCIFLEFSNNHLEKKMEDWIWSGIYLSHKYHTYAPFIDHSGNNLLMQKNPTSLLKLQVKTILNNLKVIALNDYNYAKKTGGYLYLARCEIDSLIKLKQTAPDEDKLQGLIPKENLAYLDKIVQMCKAKKIKVVLLRSPLHKRYPGTANEKTFKKVLATRYPDLRFLDFKDFPLQNDDFVDLEHLNYKGAKKISLYFNDLLVRGVLDANDQQKIVNQ